MLVFLLWWALGSSLCWASAATITALSFNIKSFRLIGWAVVIYWILLGIVQSIVLKPYFQRAYQWGLVTAIGGIFSSCLVFLGFLLVLGFLFMNTSIGLGGSLHLAIPIVVITLIFSLFFVGFLLGSIQNLILRRAGMQTTNERPILIGLTWFVGVVLCVNTFFVAKDNPFEYIIFVTLLGIISNLIEGRFLGEILDVNRRISSNSSLCKAIAKIGITLVILASFFYSSRYRLLESIGFTEALHRAVIAGKIDAKKYLAGGGNLNFNFQGSSLLHKAVAKENEALIKFLLQRGVNINQKDRNGYVPLQGAGNKKIAEYLLSHGANVNFQDNQGNTPLHSLASKKEVVELLLAKGADPNIRNKKGETPLHNINNPDSIKILIANGADVNVRDLEGFTPLYYSIKREERWNGLPSEIQQRANVTIYLIEHGADVNIQDASGKTPLHLTFNKQVTESLIAHGADVNARDREGNTPLYYKCTYIGNKELVEILIASGADVNARNNKGRTPLHWAEDKEIIETLLNHGAKINIRDNQGNTPLHSVSLDFVSNSRLGDLIKFLLANGADVTAKDNKGKTLLHYIARARARELSVIKEFVELLIKYGADINAVDNDGRTPVDIQILHQKGLQKMYGKELPTKDEKLEILRSYGGVCSKYC